MSAGGVFKLLASDGRSDRMIHATDLLNARIRDIMCQRKANGLADVTPTLADIERTHILFVNAHYKPFAALAYEYTKVRAQSGTIAWGGQILFSIPAYGEFFSDMVAHITLSAVSATPGHVPALPQEYVGPDHQVPVVPGDTAKISGTDDVVNHIHTAYTHEYVNAAGDVLVPVIGPAQNFVRYCEYPGEMLFKEVKFEINGNPLDTYTREATMFYRKFWVLHDKQDGWKRLVGQEVPVDGYSNATSIAGANAFTAPMAGLTDQAGVNSVVGTNAAGITSRKVVQVVSGFQTPKLTQPEMHLWIPLLFWFNKDIRLAIPSVSIPYGQRFITVTLESQENVVYTAPSNIYLRLTVEQRTNVAGAVNDGLFNAEQVTNVKRQVLYEPVIIPESVVNSSQTMLAELYVNNIFVNPEIHDIYIRRIGFTLVRVHRLQKQQVTVSNDNVLLSQLKWPTELIYIGMMPTENISAANPNKWRDWHNLTVVTDEILYNVCRSSGQVDPVDPSVHAAILALANDPLINLTHPPPAPYAGVLGAYTLPAPPAPRTFSSFDAFEQVDVPKYRETILSLKVTVQGNDIIDTFSTPFFRDYTPWYYGQNIMRTPVDLGALLINFCVYPGHYQPSGHINISRAREFYVQYISDYCGTGTPCEFIALGIALNFLLISDGSAVLRFTS